METADLDIVYSLRDPKWNEEFRYSLRSLKNLPHRKVWVFGGCPDWLNTKEVNVVPVRQNMRAKWDNIIKTMAVACRNKDVSDNFIWFNDDFFVMKKISKIDYLVHGTLADRIEEIKLRDKERPSFLRAKRYPERLRWTENYLKRIGKTTINYELHVPMIFNKAKLLKALEDYPHGGAQRSLYGNLYNKEFVEAEDVKVEDNYSVYKGNLPFVSTNDHTFADGVIGKSIREKFNKKCKYEKEN